MLMRKNKGYFSFAFDSAHVKYRISGKRAGLLSELRTPERQDWIGGCHGVPCIKNNTAMADHENFNRPVQFLKIICFLFNWPFPH